MHLKEARAKNKIPQLIKEHGKEYADALKHARMAAPLLDTGVIEFMRLRKNE
jgi:hypothetical protein